jgi:uncharacterized membrane protein YvlD (DUF360 family)
MSNADANSERRVGTLMKLFLRLVLNIALVYFFVKTFPTYFVVQGGTRALLLIGVTLAFLNWAVVPILHILSLPIKLFAWIVAFFLVNAAALWLTVYFITGLRVEGVSLAIAGGFVGWLTLSFFLGVGNWLVKAIVK